MGVAACAASYIGMQWSDQNSVNCQCQHNIVKDKENVNAMDSKSDDCITGPSCESWIWK